MSQQFRCQGVTPFSENGKNIELAVLIVCLALFVWLPVGRIVAPSAASVTAAIETQRPLLVTAAKAGHKKLRVLRDFSLAWGSADELEAEEPRLGSFRCPACGAQNDASADDCTNCGTPRGDAPRGSLSLALRTSKLEVEQCGFEPAPG